MEKVKIYRTVSKLKSIDVFYFDTRTDGPVIVCLHGRWGRAETWYDFIQHYGNQYRIIALDQRGHGLSSKPVSKYIPEEMAEDVFELLDLLKIDSAIIIGHSMGGRIASFFAKLYPEHIRGLAILDKSANGLEKPCTLPPNEILPIDPITKDWPLPFSSLSEAMAFIRSATESDLEYHYFMNSLFETAEGYQMMFSTQAIAANIAYDTNWFNILPEIKCPVLLMRAKGGGAVSDEDFSKMKSLIPNCLARETSHPDHNVHLANKEEFYGYFDEFLSQFKTR